MSAPVTIDLPNIGAVPLADISYVEDRIYRNWWLEWRDALGRAIEVPVSALTAAQIRWVVGGKQGDPPAASAIDQTTLALVAAGGLVLLLVLLNR